MTQLLPLRLFFPLTLLLILSFVAFAGGPLTPTVRADTDAKTVNFTDVHLVTMDSTPFDEPVNITGSRHVARNIIVGHAILVCTSDYFNAVSEAVSIWMDDSP